MVIFVDCQDTQLPRVCVDTPPRCVFKFEDSTSFRKYPKKRVQSCKTLSLSLVSENSKKGCSKFQETRTFRSEEVITNEGEPRNVERTFTNAINSVLRMLLTTGARIHVMYTFFKRNSHSVGLSGHTLSRVCEKELLERKLELTPINLHEVVQLRIARHCTL